jgi:hypothetical protein
LQEERKGLRTLKELFVLFLFLFLGFFFKAFSSWVLRREEERLEKERDGGREREREREREKMRKCM